MADAVTAVLKGGAEMQRALDDLRGDLRRRVVRAALRDAGRPVVRQAQAEAPVLQKPTPRRQKGTLRKNIKIFTSKRYKVSQGRVGVYITVRASKKDLKNAPVTGDPYYWRWVAGGHKIVRRGGGSITSRRKAAKDSVAPNPFLERAFNAKGDEAKKIFEKRIFERIAQANSKK